MNAEDAAFTLRQRRIFFVLVCLQQFFGQLGFAVLGPLFPGEAAARNVGGTVVGWVFGSFQLVIILSTPIVLKVIPRLGPTPMLNISNFVNGLSNIAFGLAWFCKDSTSFVILSFATRVVSSLGVCATMVVGAGLLPFFWQKQLSTGSAIYETVMGFAYTFGPIVGSWLYGLGGGSSSWGYVLPFFGLGALQIVFGIGVWMYLPQLPVPVCDSEGLAHFSPKVGIPIVFCFIASAGLEYNAPLLQPYLELDPFKYSIADVGWAFGAVSGLYVLSGPFMGWVDDKFGGKYAIPLMSVGTILMSIGYILIGPDTWVPELEPSIPNMWVGLCLMGLGGAMSLIPTYNTIFSCALHEDDDSKANATSALYNIVYAGGAFLGPAVAGWCGDTFGYASAFSSFAVFILGVLVALLAPLLWLRLRSSRSISASLLSARLSRDTRS
mmetsp:Transcript_88121/g.139262  ORF Transcript_88121/g.139262 Transcript_88121/m.139262 type:complete len:438 (+) Transcript_88121:81-1394(+)